ncbi:MAG: SDR family NAD(P)-dependent oxidoreductase [Aeromicrobium sp.]
MSNLSSLEGKVAIITGAAQGLGRGEALALSKEGAAVAVVDLNLSKATEVAEEIRAAGGRALPLACDVAVAEQVQAVVDSTVAEFGGVDILVNNAQRTYPAVPMEDYTEEMMRANWESGTLGTFLFMKACFPHMKDKGGRIINTASGAGVGVFPGFCGYGAAKEAIRSLTRYAAKEWGQHGIVVNCITPLAMTEAAEKANQDQATSDATMAAMSIKRFGDAEDDIGRAIVFLAGPDCSYITGNTISVDGGLTSVV